MFQDWTYMRLRSDIQRNVDYVIVNQTIWMKINKFFGGAPEIGFYLVDKKLLANENVGLEQEMQQDSTN